jgi:hypothetical protein
MSDTVYNDSDNLGFEGARETKFGDIFVEGSRQTLF